MKHHTLVVTILACLACTATASAEPLIPSITGHDFNFGAFNQQPGAVEWDTKGSLADELVFTRYNNGPTDRDQEVTAYWPDWPSPPTYPVWDEHGYPDFAGDLVLAVKFTGQDAPYVGPGGVIDVSLTGTGLNDGPAADLEIWGTIGFGTHTLSGLLWALDLEYVSLYGYSQEDAYVLEGLGTIVGGLVANEYNLIGQAGAMRGHLDFLDQPADWIPAEYNPITDQRDDQIRAAYSGETGLVPEPGALGLLLGGLGLLRRRR